MALGTMPLSVVAAILRARYYIAFLALAAALAAGACGLGGAGGFATLAIAVDESNPEKPVLVPVDGPVAVGEQVFVRLEVPRPLDAPSVRVRLQKRVGTAFQQRSDFEVAVTPPWIVAVIPVTVPEAGHWNVSLIANSRKITDVRFEAERR